MLRGALQQAIFMTSLAVCGCVHVDDPPDAALSVCDLASDPSSFDGRPVRLSGVVQAGPDFVRMFDGQCPDSMIDIRLTLDTVETEANGERLWDALYGTRSSSPLERTVAAVFAGEYRATPNRITSGTLNVSRILAVEVSR